jgi:hypothetical protein
VKKLTLLIVFAIILSSCAKEDTKEISAVRISKIVIVDYPVTNGAIPWDDPFIGSATGPDVSWKIRGSQTFTSATYLPDANGENSIEYSGQGFPITLNSPKGTYSFDIIDLDDLDGSDLGSIDDVMATINFTPYSANSTGTEIVEFSSGNATVQFEFTYLFE